MRYEYNASTGKRTEHPDYPTAPALAPTPAELQAQYTAALDGFIESVAKARGWDNRNTCALRAGYPGPLQPEGLAFAIWMDTCYMAGRQLMADVVGGKKALPTIDAFLKSLPSMEWPTQKGV